MKYEIEVLAAMVQLKRPNTKAIGSATGISERKVQSVIKGLKDSLGMVIHKSDKSPEQGFVIESWGAFETGDALRKTIESVDLIAVKAERCSQKQKRQQASESIGNKKAYFDQVKVNNYKASLKLEGISTDGLTSQGRKERITQERQAVIDKFKSTKDA